MWLISDELVMYCRIENKEIKGKCCPLFESIWLLSVSGLLVEMKGFDLNKAMSVMDGSWAVVGEWFHNYFQSYISNYFMHWLLNCISFVFVCVPWHDLAPMSSWELLYLEPTSPLLFIWSTDGSLVLFDLLDLFERWSSKYDDFTGSQEQHTYIWSLIHDIIYMHYCEAYLITDFTGHLLSF